MDTSGQHVQFHGASEKAAQTVTVKADRVPLKQLLDEIVAQVHVSVSLPKEMESEPATLSVKAVPLEDALRKLLVGKHYSLSYSEPPAGTRDHRPLVAGVQIWQEPNAIMAAASPAPAEQKPLGEAVTPSRFHSHAAHTAPEAGGAAGQTPSLSPQQIGEDPLPFDELKQSFNDATSPETRLSLLESLGNREDEGPIVPTLATALSDPDEGVRQAALEMMTASYEPIPLAPLMSMVSVETNPEALIGALTLMTDTVSSGSGTREERAAVAAALSSSTLNPNLDVREEAQLLLEQLTAQSAPASGSGSFRRPH
jgi:hypothetical protein